jgi:uncharacterized membrane protein required for colicin V production
MFAVAIQKASPWYQHLAFNWFDVAIAIVLGLGFWRGRRRGMTKELLPTLQWVAILLGAGFGHIFLANWFEQQGFVKQVFGNTFDQRTAALISAYVIIALVILIVFTVVKRKMNSKLEGSNVFGGNEYYWGIPAGIVRYASILLVALALVNAPFYSASDISRIKKYNLDNFAAGGNVKGMENDTGDFVPSLYEVQDSIFKESLIGPFIKDDLSMLLINTTPAPKKHARY